MVKKLNERDRRYVLARSDDAMMLYLVCSCVVTQQQGTVMRAKSRSIAILLRSFDLAPIDDSPCRLLHMEPAKRVNLNASL